MRQRSYRTGYPTVIALVLLLGCSHLLPCSVCCEEAPPAILQPAPTVNEGVRIPVGGAEGLPITLVRIQLQNSTGDLSRDEQLKQKLAEVFRLRPSEVFRLVVADASLARVQGLSFVQAAEYRVYATDPPGGVIVILRVTLLPEAELFKKPTGVLVSGDPKALPTLYKSDRALLVTILNGGVGIYSDTNPFFGHADKFTRGNPAATHPAGPGNTTWAEGYLEPGLGGMIQIGDLPLYPYGSVTYLGAGTVGQDIYDSGTRSSGDFERLYAGLLYDLPGKGNVINFSAGKQTYQLRDGFLISKIPGSTNIGPLGGLYLGPRLAFEKTVVGQIKVNDFMLEGIFLEPTEFKDTKTNTQLAGGTLQYNNNLNLQAGFTYLFVPRSDKLYFAPDGSALSSREGLRTFNPSLWFTNLFGLKGLWLKSEFAFQNHQDIDMAAYAWYATIGYKAEDWPWRPELSYRYSFFSGDDPTTKTYERFDPLFSGGQQNFVPGMILSNVLTNANLITHRPSFSLQPSESLKIILEYYYHLAQQLNNVGGIGPLQVLSSKDLARELSLFVTSFLGKHFYFQGVASVAFPGEAIKQAVGGSVKNWYSLQSALYFFF